MDEIGLGNLGPYNNLGNHWKNTVEVEYQRRNGRRPGSRDRLPAQASTM